MGRLQFSRVSALGWDCRIDAAQGLSSGYATLLRKYGNAFAIGYNLADLEYRLGFSPQRLLSSPANEERAKAPGKRTAA